jgi:hypothetical protein
LTRIKTTVVTSASSGRSLGRAHRTGLSPVPRAIRLAARQAEAAHLVLIQAVLARPAPPAHAPRAAA